MPFPTTKTIAFVRFADGCFYGLHCSGNGEIHLTAEETKTEVARKIPLGEEMLEVLRIMRVKWPNDETRGTPDASIA